LLAAVGPDQVAPVQSYLQALESVGAFAVPREAAAASGALDLDSLGAGCSGGLFESGGRQLVISLAGDTASLPQGSFLVFLERTLAARWLGRLGSLNSGDAPTPWQALVLTPSGHPDRGEFARRARIARWLLSSAAGPDNHPGALQLYELPASGITLRRTVIAAEAETSAAADGDVSSNSQTHADAPPGAKSESPPPLTTLVDQLGALSPGDAISQLPLVVSRASSDWLGAQTGWRYGLDQAPVRRAVLDEFLGRLATVHGAAITLFEGPIKDGPANGTSASLKGQADAPWFSSAEELLIHLLERREGQRPEGRPISFDLLHEEPEGFGEQGQDLIEELRCVRALLKDRFESLEAVSIRTTSGATIVRSLGARACSFFPRRALLETALALLWRDAYPELADEPAAPAVGREKVGAEEPALLRRFPGERARLWRTRVWGREIWTGQLFNDRPGGH
ncbi:MAG: hypothetical protein AAGM22_08050, partial [Acidobacteriota bacterium]